MDVVWQRYFDAFHFAFKFSMLVHESYLPPRFFYFVLMYLGIETTRPQYSSSYGVFLSSF